MYYEEKIINGVLHHRSTPTGLFKPFTPEEMTAKWAEVNEQLKQVAQAFVGGPW